MQKTLAQPKSPRDPRNRGAIEYWEPVLEFENPSTAGRVEFPLSLAFRYLDRLGLDPRWSRAWAWWPGRRWRERAGGPSVSSPARVGWRRFDGANCGHVARALGGAYGLALGAPVTSYFGFDVDLHGEPGPALPDDDMDAWARPSRPGKGREAALPAIRRIRRMLPGAKFAYCATPRGLHVVGFLERPAPVEQVHAAVREIAARASRPELPVEPLVTPARTGRLPLTGPHARLLRADLAGPKIRGRAGAVEALLELGPTPLELLTTTAERIRAKRRPENPVGESPTLSKKPVGPRSTQIPSSLRERLNSEVRGAAFARTIAEAHRHGLPDDSSYGAAEKLAFCSIGLGLDDDRAIAFARAWIALPHHEASHARTRSGRDAWVQSFASSRRRLARRGVRADISNAEIVAVFEETIGALDAERRTIRYAEDQVESILAPYVPSPEKLARRERARVAAAKRWNLERERRASERAVRRIAAARARRAWKRIAPRANHSLYCSTRAQWFRALAHRFASKSVRSGSPRKRTRSRAREPDDG